MLDFTQVLIQSAKLTHADDTPIVFNFEVAIDVYTCNVLYENELLHMEDKILWNLG